MKLRLLASSLMLMLFLCMTAQTWDAPQVPGADLTNVKSTDIVYLYNVDADVFAINGMDWNTNATTTRLNNSNTKASDAHQCYAMVAEVMWECDSWHILTITYPV